MTLTSPPYPRSVVEHVLAQVKQAQQDLQHACGAGEVQTARAAFERGGDVHALVFPCDPDPRKRTRKMGLVHWALEKNHKDLLAFALQAGCDATGVYKNTFFDTLHCFPLVYAGRLGRAALCKLLVMKGVDPFMPLPRAVVDEHPHGVRPRTLFDYMLSQDMVMGVKGCLQGLRALSSPLSQEHREQIQRASVHVRSGTMIEALMPEIQETLAQPHFCADWYKHFSPYHGSCEKIASCVPYLAKYRSLQHEYAVTLNALGSWMSLGVAFIEHGVSPNACHPRPLWWSAPFSVLNKIHDKVDWTCQTFHGDPWWHFYGGGKHFERFLESAGDVGSRFGFETEEASLKHRQGALTAWSGFYEKGLRVTGVNPQGQSGLEYLLFPLMTERPKKYSVHSSEAHEKTKTYRKTAFALSIFHVLDADWYAPLSPVTCQQWKSVYKEEAPPNATALDLFHHLLKDHPDLLKCLQTLLPQIELDRERRHLRRVMLAHAENMEVQPSLAAARPRL